MNPSNRRIRGSSCPAESADQLNTHLTPYRVLSERAAGDGGPMYVFSTRLTFWRKPKTEGFRRSLSQNDASSYTCVPLRGEREGSNSPESESSSASSSSAVHPPHTSRVRQRLPMRRRLRPRPLMQIAPIMEESEDGSEEQSPSDETASQSSTNTSVSTLPPPPPPPRSPPPPPPAPQPNRVIRQWENVQELLSIDFYMLMATLVLLIYFIISQIME